MLLRVRVVVFLFVVAVGWFAWSAGMSTQANMPSIRVTDAASGLTSFRASCSAWVDLASPGGTHTDDYLSGVDTVSANDAWAVGKHGMIQHWDGVQWTIVSAPSASMDYDLVQVEAISSTDVWAVGGSISPSSGVVIHWNGSVWSSIANPSTGTVNDLAAVSATDVWISYGASLSHWDGSDWTTQATPNGEVIYGLDAAGSNNVWAVGVTSDLRGASLHWNGANWTAYPVPMPLGGEALYLKDVATLASGETWAVGEWQVVTRDASGNGGLMHHRSAIAKWDGAVWTQVGYPSFEYPTELLIHVDAVTPDKAWILMTGQCYQCGNQPMYVTLEGTAISTFPMPDSSPQSGLSIAAGDDVWAIGGKYVAQPPKGGGSDGGVPRRVPLIRRYVQVTCPTPIPTPTATSTVRCPGERFKDVCASDYFYQHVLDLNDLGVIAGYNTSPPCSNADEIPCFKPYNWSTRGQIAKVISLAAGFNEPVSGQSFEDVPSTHTFYEFIERLTSRGIVSGFACGAPNEPCGAENLPYFRPGATTSRGQLAKMASLAFGFMENQNGQHFQDIVPGSPFYTYVERLAIRELISGYDCGGANEPCVPPNDYPYFRPAQVISRGQTSKIVNLARAVQSPIPTATPVPGPCDGIPAAENMTITPTNCGPVGTTFTFVGSGFNSGEQIQLYYRTPDGSVFASPNYLQADASGDVEPIDFVYQQGSPVGTGRLYLMGITSQHLAIGPFRLLGP